MDVTPYIDSLRRDLVAAAEAGGEEIRHAAERLTMALDPAARLAFMEAISHTAAEITAEMPAGGVEVRLSGRELDFVVSAGTPVAPSAPLPPPPPAPEETDEGGMARITLRIPESVKTRAEEQATRAGVSLNTWLVNLVRAATSDSAINVDIDLSSIPFLEGLNRFSGPSGKAGRRGTRRMTGWV